MGMSHHGDGQPRQQNPELDSLMKRFIEQVEGRAKREYMDGRLAPDDEGSLAVAVAADQRHGVVRIDFGKPVPWVALRPHEVVAFVKMLMEKAREVSREPLVFQL